MAIGAVACSQRVTPEEEYAEEERGRAVLPAERTPPALGGTGRERPGRVMPGAAEPGGEVAPEGSAEAIRGVVELAGGVDSDEGTVYLFVRPAGATAGAPLAVQRHPAASLPLEFAIGPADAMMAGTSFPDRVTVEARLDRDGDAMTTDPGDPAAHSDPVRPGTTGLSLVLE